MSNRTYDLVVLLDADAPTDTRTKIVTDAQTLIGQHGEVKANKDWGTRQLPYLIDHHEQAAYHIFQFESDPQAISKLDRGLKLTEGVLRFRIFETQAGKELPSSPPLFKREERAYERPPREASATPRSDQPDAKPAAAPAAGEAPAAETAEAPSETVVEVAADAVPVDAVPVDAVPVDAVPVDAVPAEPAESTIAEAEVATETPAEVVAVEEAPAVTADAEATDDTATDAEAAAPTSDAAADSE